LFSPPYSPFVISHEDIDLRLSKIGKDRKWLAENTPYSADYLRTVLAPGSTRRTKRVMQIISAAIEAEEERQAAPQQEIPPGYSEIFLNDEQLNLADRASRIVGAPSLADFCRTAILQEARRILTKEAATAAERKTA